MPALRNASRRTEGSISSGLLELPFVPGGACEACRIIDAAAANVAGHLRAPSAVGLTCTLSFVQLEMEWPRGHR
jgi:hypothetical protein